MNSFTEWLKVVLAVAMLALLAGMDSFYFVADRRAFRAFRSPLRTARPAGRLTMNRFPGVAGNCEPYVEGTKS